jgi:hypothetical protein
VKYLAILLFAFTAAAADVATARAASDARPQHPTLLVKLAIALSANGQHDEAVAVLDRVASMGFVYSLKEPELDPVRARVAEKFAANARPIGSAKTELTVPRKGMIPEGIAYDGRRFYVSSVRLKSIFADGRVLVELPTPVYGMAVDKTLWAAGESAVYEIDPRTGRVLQTLTVLSGAPGSQPGAGRAESPSLQEEPHHFGDIAIASDGHVFVSDSKGTQLYHVEGGALVPFLTGPFRSLQGLAPWREKLYVADYSNGLFAVDRRTRDLVAVKVPSNVSLLGVDGLYAVDGRTLVATQNGTNPNRILRIRLTADGLAVESVRTLLANDPRMTDPTLGVLARNRFFFNANGQWEEKDPARQLEALVLSVPVH